MKYIVIVVNEAGMPLVISLPSSKDEAEKVKEAAEAVEVGNDRFHVVSMPDY